MWTRHTAPDGRPYYYNAVLKKSSWTQPAEFPGGPQAGSDRPTWEQHRAPDGRVYFFNRETKQSKWTRPEGVTIVNKAGADAGGYLGAPGTHENATKDASSKRTTHGKGTTTEPAGEKLFALLDSWAGRNGVTSLSTTFEDAATSLSTDPIWRLVSTDEERIGLFDRWVESKREEARQADRRRLHEYFEGACPWITVKTTWKQALDALQGKAEFERLGKYDQVDVFDAFMAKVEARAVQSQLVDDEIRQRKESQGRIALRKIFREHLNQGEIHAKLTWKEYLASNAGQCARAAIRGVEGSASGSRPRDLFMDVIEEAEIAYERDRPRIAAVGPGDADTLRNVLKDDVAEASVRLFLLESESQEADDDGGRTEGAAAKRQRIAAGQAG